MMGFGWGGGLRRDWFLGALQENLQFRARVAEHYREELYDRISNLERMSERLEDTEPRETRDKRPRPGARPPAERFPSERLHDRMLENRRHRVNWWEDRFRLWAQQIDLYIEFLHSRSDRLRDIRESHRGEVERKTLKAEAAATPDGEE